MIWVRWQQIFFGKSEKKTRQPCQETARRANHLIAREQISPVFRTRCSALRAAPQSRDPQQIERHHGPRISSAPRRKCGALHSIRGTSGARRACFSRRRNPPPCRQRMADSAFSSIHRTGENRKDHLAAVSTIRSTPQRAQHRSKPSRVFMALLHAQQYPRRPGALPPDRHRALAWRRTSISPAQANSRGAPKYGRH